MSITSSTIFDMFCSKCGKSITGRFCGQCGKLADTPAPPTTSDKLEGWVVGLAMLLFGMLGIYGLVAAIRMYLL